MKQVFDRILERVAGLDVHWIELTDEERGRLEAWSRRRKTSQALALRSR